MKLTFFGAAQRVTGSNSMIEAAGKKILIDCGAFQGSPQALKKNFDPMPYDPSTVDALLVTHSHIDHIGRTPKLVREGFKGTIYSSEPTKDFAKIFLEDELKIMEKEWARDGFNPVWEQQDLEATMGLWKAVNYHEKFFIGSVEIELFDAGHILGSAIIKITAEGKSVLFSGDLGNPPTPIIAPTETPHNIDYIIMESTYGDRIHEERGDRKTLLERAIEDSFTNDGVLLIPAFAMERTQELLFEINELVEHNRVPETAVYLDSPLAIKATEIYRRHQDYFNKEAKGIISSGDDIFDFPRLKFTRSGEESKRILDVPPPKLIIAGSGMSTGGRILFHERNYLEDPSTIILFIGFQVKGTLGRQIKDGNKKVRIMGENITVNAQIRTIEGYSAHADQEGLLEWAGAVSTDNHKPKRIFINHGEQDPAEALAKRISDDLHIATTIPKEGEGFVL